MLSRPRVVSTDPADGATGVAVDTRIAVTFSEAMSEEMGAVVVSPAGDLDLSWQSGRETLIVEPVTALRPGPSNETVTRA